MRVANGASVYRARTFMRHLAKGNRVKLLLYDEPRFDAIWNATVIANMLHPVVLP
jgi:hypothetical protein